MGLSMHIVKGKIERTEHYGTDAIGDAYHYMYISGQVVQKVFVPHPLQARLTDDEQTFHFTLYKGRYILTAVEHDGKMHVAAEMTAPRNLLPACIIAMGVIIAWFIISSAMYMPGSAAGAMIFSIGVVVVSVWLGRKSNVLGRMADALNKSAANFRQPVS